MNNRIILFRGKTESGEWVYGDLIHRLVCKKIGCYEQTPPTHSDPCGDTVWFEYEVIPETVGQQIAVKGKSFFEGDKIERWHQVKNYEDDDIGMPRTWNTPQFSQVKWEHTVQLDRNTFDQLTSYEDWKISGNIHESTGDAPTPLLGEEN